MRWTFNEVNKNERKTWISRTLICIEADTIPKWPLTLWLSFFFQGWTLLKIAASCIWMFLPCTLVFLISCNCKSFWETQRKWFLRSLGAHLDLHILSSSLFSISVKGLIICGYRWILPSSHSFYTFHWTTHNPTVELNSVGSYLVNECFRSRIFQNHNSTAFHASQRLEKCVWSSVSGLGVQNFVLQ